MSIKAKSAIQSGKNLENYIVDEIIKRGLSDTASRTPGSGSGIRDKRDVNSGNMMILDRTVGIEAKHQQNLNVHDCWKQTQLLEKQGYEPILVYKRKTDTYGDTKAVIYLSTLLDLIKNQGNTNIETGIPKSDKWIIKAGIDSLKKILKLLEKYT